MKFKTIIAVCLLAFAYYSCSNMPVNKVPGKFILDITSNLNDLSNILLTQYKTNTIILTNKIKDSELKSKLSSIKVDYLQVLYKYDSTVNVPYQVMYINQTKADSIIIFGKFKSNRRSLDSWQTNYEVDYYFGRNKPNVPLYNYKGDSRSAKINDSIYTFSLRFPNR